METETPPHSNHEAKRKVILIIVAMVVAIIFFMRHGHDHSPAPAAAIPTVAVAKVTREDLFNEVTIPAEFRPYVEVELHAKVSGYVDKMKVDFGDQVKSNQLLATIEVPELGDQLRSAIAIQHRAEVDYTNAHLLYTRLQSVNKEHPNLVAQQELDTAESKDAGADAAVASAKADAERYQTLAKYTQITAPFDSVVTKRYADPGTLIQAGTSSDSALPLLRVSDNYRLRLDFPVSVSYVKDVRTGDSVNVRVESLNGKTFAGVITRFMGKVNEDTRTMIVEVEVANPNLEIVPGMYAAVELKVQRRPQAVAIPIEALGSDKNTTVTVVNTNSEIEVRPVKLGLETSDKYEVTSGLAEGEMVMIGNRALVQPGQIVTAKLIEPITVK